MNSIKTNYINADVIDDNADIFVGENYLGKTQTDIKEIILLYLINSITKIQSVERIKDICSKNIIYQYRLCDNVALWKLLWTKNISNKVPEPEKLKKILSNIMKTKNYHKNNKIFYDNINFLIKIVIDYMQNKNMKNYIQNLYESALKFYGYYDKNMLETLKFNLLFEKAVKNDEALQLYYNDIFFGLDIQDILKKNYWDDIDYVYNNPEIFYNTEKLDKYITLKRFTLGENSNKPHQVTTYIDILIEKGFDINQIFFNLNDSTHLNDIDNITVLNYIINNNNSNISVVNFLGYSIISVYPTLFEYLLYKNANINQVSPGIDAESLIIIHKNKVSQKDSIVLDEMLNILENYKFMNN